MKSINPVGLYATQGHGFSQGVIHAQTLFTSGVVGYPSSPQYAVSESFEGQFDQAIRNLSLLLANIELEWQQVIHLRFYVVGLQDTHTQLISQFLVQTYQGPYRPATTILGVARLARESLLVEIECTAQWVE